MEVGQTEENVPPMRAIAFDDVPEVVAEPPGIEGTQLNRHLFGMASAGTPGMIAETIRFEPGFIHHMHRHPNVDQIMMPLEGTMVMFDENREARELRVGEVVVIPRLRWHEPRNLGDEPCVVLHMFSGVGDNSEVGFELWPSGGDDASRPVDG